MTKSQIYSEISLDEFDLIGDFDLDNSEYEESDNETVNQIDLEEVETEKVMELCTKEYFDVNAMDYIINNKEKLTKLFIENGREFDTEQYNVFNMLDRYNSKSINGEVEVSYYQNKDARFEAYNGLSYQGMLREIRGLLGKDLYYDIDMVNCHPTILEKICKDKKTKCRQLSKYINNREKVIANILEENKDNKDIDRDYVKNMIIAMINGGSKKYKLVKNKTKWLKKFYTEIKAILNKMKLWYPDFYNENDTNPAGKAMAYSLQVKENEYLQIILSYMQENGLAKDDYILCYDGIMILKNNINKKDITNAIEEIEDLFEENYKINIMLKIKELDISAIPEDGIPQQVKRDFIEDNGYYYVDFIDEIRSKIYNDLNELKNAIKINLNRVMFKVHKGGKIATKVSNNDFVQLSTHYPDTVFKYLKKENKERVQKYVSIQTLIQKYGMDEYLDVYKKLTFNPKFIGHKNRIFNTWSGFQAKLKQKEDININSLKPVLDFLEVVWCYNDREILIYFLSWFQHCFKYPWEKTKIGIILFSEQQQIGKGVFINKFLIPLIFGDKYGISIDGLDSVTGQFNTTLKNKIFVNCDEVQSTNASFHGKFDTMKKLVSDQSIEINEKFQTKEKITNYLNFIFTSNNSDCFKIEDGDRRYATFECNPIYAGNRDFFDNLVENIFTQEIADDFFSYCYHFENPVNIRNIPKTNIKTEMSYTSLPSHMKFLKTIEEIRASDETPPISESEMPSWEQKMKYYNEFKAKDFYNLYLKFCDDNKIQQKSILGKIPFAKKIKNKIEKKRKTGGIYYQLNSLQLN